jgi:chemotaxis protein CheX
MNAECINPFVVASINVLRSVAGVEPSRGSVTVRPRMFTTQQCNILTGITGKVEGQIIYGMSLATADRIASQMLAQTVVTFDQAAANAICDLGSRITGQATDLLDEAGYPTEMTPPTLVRGANVNVSTLDVPAFVIPIALGDLGEFEINVSLQERHT